MGLTNTVCIVHIIFKELLNVSAAAFFFFISILGVGFGLYFHFCLKASTCFFSLLISVISNNCVSI